MSFNASNNCVITLDEVLVDLNFSVDYRITDANGTSAPATITFRAKAPVVAATTYDDKVLLLHPVSYYRLNAVAPFFPDVQGLQDASFSSGSLQNTMPTIAATDTGGGSVGGKRLR